MGVIIYLCYNEERKTKQRKMAKLIQSKVCNLAYDLVQNQEMNQSEAMQWAWHLCKKYPNSSIVVFEKTNGDIRRALCEPWSKHNTPKGTGKPLPLNRVLYTGMDKLDCGLPSTISMYTHLIIKKVA